MAGIAAVCVLVSMGVVDHSADRRAEAAAPAQGWRPERAAALQAPARQAVQVTKPAAGSEHGRD